MSVAVIARYVFQTIVDFFKKYSIMLRIIYSELANK